MKLIVVRSMRVSSLLVLLASMVLFGCATPTEPPRETLIFNAHMHAAYLGMDDAAYRAVALHG